MRTPDHTGSTFQFCPCLSVLVRLLVSVLLLAVFNIVASAQVTTATITGTVADQDGAVVPGTQITVSNELTGFSRTATTDGDGTYVVPQLPPGEYTVAAEKTGFSRAVLSNITLQVAQVARVNLVMTVGSTSQTVLVSTETPLVQTDNSEVGQVIEHRQVAGLPLNGRFFLQLALLTPGVVENAGGTPAQNLAGTQGPQLSISGNRQDANSYTIDGVSGQDFLYNTLAVSPVVDAIQEFKVQSSLSSVQWGGQGGGFVNIVTRSGTNRLHGSAWGYLRNDKLNSRNYFDDPNRPVPPYKQHQYGGTIGGPILKDRTFFFGSYEGLQIRQTLTGLFSVATLQMRQGDFSAYAANPALAAQVPRDPLTGLPFPNNRIPQNRINNATRILMERLLPAPTDSNPNQLSNNFLGTPLRIVDSNQFSIRGDHRIGQSDSLFGRFLYLKRTGTEPFPQQQFVAGGTNLPGYGTHLNADAKSLALGYTKSLSPTTVTDFRFGYNQISGGTVAQALGEDYGALTGIQGLTTDPVEIGPPFINISGFNPFGPGGGNLRNNKSYEFRSNTTLLRGRHSFDFGAGVLSHTFEPLTSGRRGSFTFNGFLTGNAFADFLLGIPQTASNTFGESTITRSKSKEFNLYIGDKVRISPRFTLDLGLRYDYKSPWKEVDGRMAILKLNPLQLVIPSSDGQFIGQDFLNSTTFASVNARIPIVGSEAAGYPEGLIEPDRNNFSPRIGFAWSPFKDRNIVVRGGYGLFYSFIPLWVPWLGSFSNRIPFVESRATQNFQPALRLPIETSLTAAAGAATYSFFSTHNEFRTPYIQQITLGTQYSPSNDWVFEVRWNFTKGTKLYTSEYFNFPAVQGSPLTRPFTALTAGSIFIGNQGFSTYHSGTFRGEKRFSNGFNVSGSYVWSRAIDNDSLMASTTTSNLRQRPAASDLRGLSSFHVSHRFVANYRFELPFGRGRRWLATADGLTGKLVEGWYITGITTMQTGLPFTVNIGQDRCGTGVANCRPNQIRDANLPRGERTVTRWFDTSAFVLQPVNTYGSAGRSTIYAPGIHTWDVSFGKETSLMEGHSLRLQIDLFNAFNSSQWGIPQRIIDAPGFGTIQRAGDPRLVQLSIKYSF
jgi:hypothetical protein